MDNQQGSVKDLVLLDNIDLSDVKHRKVKNIESFVLDIHLEYDELKDKYGLSRDEVKRLKRKVYEKFDASLPTGYKEYPHNNDYILNEVGTVRNKRKRNILNQFLNHKGYRMTDLGRSRKASIHRLVAETFIPNPDNKPQVNHINGCKEDNRSCNLEWVTPRENVIHGINKGLIVPIDKLYRPTGSKNFQSKLTEEDVNFIRNSSMSIEELANKYNVSRATILDILSRRTWRHI